MEERSSAVEPYRKQQKKVDEKKKKGLSDIIYHIL